MARSNAEEAPRSPNDPVVAMDAKLMVATDSGDVNKLKELLKKEDAMAMVVVTAATSKKPSKDDQSRSGDIDPLLLESACGGSLQDLNDLLKKPPIPQYQESLGDAEEGVDHQAAAGAFLKGVTANGDTALHVVASNGDSQDFLNYAAIIHGRDRGLLFTKNDKGDTPLHCACRAGNYEMVSCLIELAEDRKFELLREVNHRQETALHEAVRFEDGKTLDYKDRALLDAGTIKGKEEEIIKYINKDRSPKMVKLLMDADTQLANFPAGGISPMYLAILLGKETIASSGSTLPMADPNPTSSAPATTAAATTSNLNLDTDPHTPLNQQSSFRPRAPPTPHLGAGRDLFSDAPASLPMLPTSVAPTAAPAIPNPTPAAPTLSIHDINIGNYINFKVQTSGAKLSKWRKTFTYILTMCQALDHVTAGAAAAVPSAAWLADDIHLCLMFMATIADDLFRIVQGTDDRASTIWQRLHGIFFAHQSTRYVYLSKVFRTTPRGDLGISAYASILQAIADDLADIGYPVADHDLTMQFLAGLGGKFRMQTEMIENNPPLPPFADVFSRLLLAEYNIDHNQREEGAHAMAVHGGRGGGPHGGGSTHGDIVPNSSGGPAGDDRRNTGSNRGYGRGTPSAPMAGVSPNYRGKNPIPGFVHHNQGGRGRGGAPSSGGAASSYPGGVGTASQTPWLGYFAPMGAQFQPARLPWAHMEKNFDENS
ncbi:hypothetical protein QYE76_000343 [Lolium multiflorum]|uniref:Ankyrin repeat protein n=1 Tax=Lolium multiflorum TaxID=4521 RepID=A0AAD8VYA1_LOLMU|nr:hypothetical protein QYE76_000333 [Lolium multiflorum]KAK1626024.1 hypothetical protein QYE76_000339 [Lolium multiflorum]KAK1626028.1 hypothetical protein QYE76_000343 [Lolium multiflorum]